MFQDLPDSGLWRCLQVVLMMRFRSYLRIVCTTVAFMNNERMDESDVSASVASQTDYIPYWDVFSIVWIHQVIHVGVPDDIECWI